MQSYQPPPLHTDSSTSKLSVQPDLFTPSAARLDKCLGAISLKEICNTATWRTCDAQSAMDIPAIMAFTSNIQKSVGGWENSNEAWKTCLLLDGQVYQSQGVFYRILKGGGSKQGATLAWPMSRVTWKGKNKEQHTVFRYQTDVVDLPWLTCALLI